MKKTMFARLSVLPLPHKIAAVALSFSVAAVGARTVQISSLFSALQQVVGSALRSEILPNRPRHGGQDGHWTRPNAHLEVTLRAGRETDGALNEFRIQTRNA